MEKSSLQIVYNPSLFVCLDVPIFYTNLGIIAISNFVSFT
jgi:hypothetical protein